MTQHSLALAAALAFGALGLPATAAEEAPPTPGREGVTRSAPAGRDGVTRPGKDEHDEEGHKHERGPQSAAPS